MTPPPEEAVFPEDQKLSDQGIKNALENPIYFSDDNDEEADVEDLLKIFQSMDKAIRPPPSGAQHMIANELALAVVSPSIEKIRHICEAYMILSQEDIKSLGLIEIHPMILRTYALTQTFQRYREAFDYDEYANPREMVKVAFPFPESEAVDYLHPWATNIPFESYQTRGRLASRQIEDLTREYNEKFKEATEVAQDTGEVDVEVIDMMHSFKAKYLYWCFRDGVTHETFNSFVVAFIIDSTPKAMQWFKKIMMKVSPSSFRDALQSFGAIMPRR